MNALDMSEAALRARITATTVTGRTISILGPMPEDIALEDIAVGLSRQCRYAGQIRRFYSVAEHSVWCAREVELRGGDVLLQRYALLHDAAEAYIGDLTRPVKLALRSLAGVECSGFDAIEAGLIIAIAQRFDLPPTFDELPLIKSIDEQACAREQQALRKLPAGWRPHVEPLRFTPECWDPERAQYHFETTAVGLGLR